jgi:hypothetical protein
MPETVGEEALGVAGKVVQRREPIVKQGVPDPHRRQRVLLSKRDVLGHAFDKPEGDLHETPKATSLRSTSDVKLE